MYKTVHCVFSLAFLRLLASGSRAVLLEAGLQHCSLSDSRMDVEKPGLEGLKPVTLGYISKSSVVLLTVAKAASS